MRAFGAELTVIPSNGGRVTPDLVPRMMEKARRARQRARHLLHGPVPQRRCASSATASVGVELLEQIGRPIDVFCAAVGTGGLAMGVAEALAEAGSPARVVVLRACLHPGLDEGHGRVAPGRGDRRRVPRRHCSIQLAIDEARAIEEEDGRKMARRLAREEGLLAGTSTGLNVCGAIGLAEELGPGKTVVTVAVDTGLKYLAGDLYEG